MRLAPLAILGREPRTKFGDMEVKLASTARRIFGQADGRVDLTEVWRTRPERTRSGVVRGGLSLPSPWEVGRGGESGRMNCHGDRLHF